MRSEDIIWLDHVVEKLAYKHNVMQSEVEEALLNNPRIRLAEKGYHQGEDMYMALGQSGAGRYLAVVFVRKKGNKALVISARDMAAKERKQYGRK